MEDPDAPDLELRVCIYVWTSSTEMAQLRSVPEELMGPSLQEAVVQAAVEHVRDSENFEMWQLLCLCMCLYVFVYVWKALSTFDVSK